MHFCVFFQLQDPLEINSCIREATSRIELGKESNKPVYDNNFTITAVHYNNPYPRPVSRDLTQINLSLSLG